MKVDNQTNPDLVEIEKQFAEKQREKIKAEYEAMQKV